MGPFDPLCDTCIASPSSGSNCDLRNIWQKDGHSYPERKAILPNSQVSTVPRFFFSFTWVPWHGLVILALNKTPYHRQCQFLVLPIAAEAEEHRRTLGMSNLLQHM
uniref:Uncharacterized protein LOC112813699 isoform X2 n=1 Tax=Callorhinus ursinus TaxID=34884 RepID=A0A3Q7N164_CALUR|nr:uncharacterized protein LOC112813699 isoform X2 [Callorhinus ursinus]